MPAMRLGQGQGTHRGHGPHLQANPLPAGD